MRFVRSGSVDGFATKHCHLPTHHDLPSSAPGHAFGERSSFVLGRSSQGQGKLRRSHLSLPAFFCGRRRS